MALFLLSCNASEEEYPYTPVLFASLTAGESVSDVQLYHAGRVGHDDLLTTRIFMRPADGVRKELARSGNEFYDPDEQPVEPASTYYLDVLLPNGRELSCKANVPPAIALNSISSQQVSVSAPGTVASILTWTSLGDAFAYAMKLECLENNPIPIDETPGLFESRNGLSQLQSQLILLKDDFSFYGTHRLTVYAFDSGLESMYFYDPSDIRGLLQNPPDNVSGGRGYATGISKFVVDIEIIQ
jgi:hypothetical protein